MASSLADNAVETYRTRVQAQIEQRRLNMLHASMLVSAALAAVGMVVDAVALQQRVGVLQRAVDEAVADGDLAAAEHLRGQLVAALEEPTASAKLLATLADSIPATMASYSRTQREDEGNVIEGQTL